MKLRRNAKIELLRAVPLFSGCTSKELGQISALGDELSQPAGTELITEGVKGREFFVLVDGTVEVRRKGRRVATLRDGRLLRRDRAAHRDAADGDRRRGDARAPARRSPASRSGGSSATPRRSRGRCSAALAERMKRDRRVGADDVLRRLSGAPGPEWDPARPLEGQSGWAGPRRLHGRARRHGFVVLGGPLADEGPGRLAVEAASEADVRATLARDPGARPTSSSTASTPGRSGSTAGRRRRPQSSPERTTSLARFTGYTAAAIVVAAVLIVRRAV